jgi:F-type H+-transporting ATPase subunit epsilon
MPSLTCTVVTPEATALDRQVDFVVVPLYDGELGIGAGHSPLIGRLTFGELRLKTGDKVDRYYVGGGFVQVADNVVSVLTDRAVPATEVDAEAAQAQLTEASERQAHSPELIEIRDRQLAQARAQLQVSRRSRSDR